MKIIISPACKSLTGSLGRGFGYSIQRQRNGFYSKRDSKGIIPPEGHWRFIVACAELAQIGLHIADIKVSQKEIMKALHEMHRGDYLWQSRYPKTLNAADILTLKERLAL